MAQQRALPQSKETLLQSYNKRLKDDIKSMMDNFTEIIKTAKIEDETQVSRATQGEQDNYEMHVRASNIRPCEGHCRSPTLQMRKLRPWLAGIQPRETALSRPHLPALAVTTGPSR
uniref:Mediator of RNA polymerase II transcription subunit 22 n=1 Tax=Myotis myotis TaxID=51298 RepID=A0A7J7UQ02_MYOMY|nr:mediator complex subunit 22 [Myotis myotis]